MTAADDVIEFIVEPPRSIEFTIEPPPAIEMTVTTGVPVPGAPGDPATLFDSDESGRLILSGGGPNDTNGA